MGQVHGTAHCRGFVCRAKCVEALDRRDFDASLGDTSALGERPRADFGWRRVSLDVEDECAGISTALSLQILFLRQVRDGGKDELDDRCIDSLAVMRGATK